MAENLIETIVSPKQLTFKPGGSPASFEVTVINDSDRFASFQLEVIAAGADSNRNSDWYSISPEVSTKKPPGDSTQFHVAIKDTPVPGFVGQMNLEVRVFSMELGNEDRAILRLILEQGTGFPLKLDLPIEKFQAYPGNQIEIPVLVYNPGQLSTNAVLSCLELDSTWLLEGIERRLNLPLGGQATCTFLCQLPLGMEAFSKLYPFTIEARHQYGPPARIRGVLEILPTGAVKFRCTPKIHYLPPKSRGLPKRRSDPVTYLLEFENASNLYQQVSVQIQGKDQQKSTLEVIPEQGDLIPGQATQLQLVANSRRRRWGRTQKLQLVVAAVLSDRRLGEADPPTETVELRVRPLIPLWLQIGAGLLLLLLLLLPWWWSLLPRGHKGPVRSVSFNGLGDWVISGSDDQTIRQWRVKGNRIEPAGILGTTDRAVRVVRYQPVDNNVVAVGLENGDIQLWDLLSGKHRDLIAERDDRVFDLEFTKDSRYLFSGHGNDLVLQWDIEGDRNSNPTDSSQPRKQKLNFTVSDIALVGQGYKYIAIGGRYNRLVLLNLSGDKAGNKPPAVPYSRPGSQDDYISSLAVATNKPNLMAVADNQGYISLWDLSQCLINSDVPCQKLDEWRGGQDAQSVRSVALSTNGCYLTSVGDDKRLVLWPLTANGQRVPKFSDGEILNKFSKNLNSVDVKVVGKDILIATAGDDHQVRLRRERRLPNLGCDSP